MSDLKYITGSRAFWLQSLYAVCSIFFEAGLTGRNELYIIGMILFVNVARVYLASEIAILAKHNEFEADTIGMKLDSLSWSNAGYMLLVIFLKPLFGWFGIGPQWAESTYLLFLFCMSSYAAIVVFQAAQKRSAEDAQQVSRCAQLEAENAQLVRAGEQQVSKIAHLSAQLSAECEQQVLAYDQEVRSLRAQVSKYEQQVSESAQVIAQLGKRYRENGRTYYVVFEQGRLVRKQAKRKGGQYAK